MSLNAPPAARKDVLPMSAFPARPALARRLAPAAVHVHPAARVKSAKVVCPTAITQEMDMGLRFAVGRLP